MLRHKSGLPDLLSLVANPAMRWFARASTAVPNWVYPSSATERAKSQI
jgi:hypothetical protein